MYDGQFFSLIKISGQDFAIDICGAADVLRPIVLMMVRCQTVDLPPWKIPTWFDRMIHQLESTAEELEKRKGFTSSLSKMLYKMLYNKFRKKEKIHLVHVNMLNWANNFIP